MKSVASGCALYWVSNCFAGGFAEQKNFRNKSSRGFSLRHLTLNRSRRIVAMRDDSSLVSSLLMSISAVVVFVFFFEEVLLLLFIMF